MKNLLQKSLKQLSIFAFLVFTLSIPSYFLLVDWIWLKELDENNHITAQRIEHEFNDQNITDEKLASNIKFWNEIQPVSKIEFTNTPLKESLTYTIKRQNNLATDEAIDRFRGLKTNIKINNKNYVLTIETNVEETEETVGYIAMVTLLFFLILVLGFWFINRTYAKKLWQPFQDTLHKLKEFQLNKEKRIEFLETDTIEFAELNSTLDKLIQHSINTYKTQKEFTENASHELQTPLAILKNKLDLLMQSDDLTEKQYLLAEEMNKALLRSSRINKNLLLLSKIENNQYDNKEQIHFGELLEQCIEGLEAHFKEKNIHISAAIRKAVFVQGNIGLTEVLINNLLINAVRHTAVGGSIRITLTEKIFNVANSGEQALEQDLLFKRFSRISSSNKGSGLGLSIVQEICKLHHWQISYQFENKHHEFNVLFPQK